MKTSKKAVSVARDMASILIAFDALDQALKKVTDFDGMTHCDRLIVNLHKKLDRILRIYRGTKSLKNASLIAVNAYDKVGHSRPNATSFAIGVIGLAYQKSGLKHFPVTTTEDLCTISDAISEVLGDESSQMNESYDYAEKIVEKIYKSHPDHIRIEGI